MQRKTTPHRQTPEFIPPGHDGGHESGQQGGQGGSQGGGQGSGQGDAPGNSHGLGSGSNQGFGSGFNHAAKPAAGSGPTPGSGQGSSSQPGGAGTGLLFLREEQMRLAQDLFFFAYRDLTACADAILEELDLGRAHHRALHFIGRRPGIAVSELLALLRITKQSLARVLGELVERGYVVQAQGPTDRRQRLLSLTAEGQALERRLFERQRQKMVAAYREAGGVAVEGFRRVMRGVMDGETRVLLDPSDGAAPPLRQVTG